MGNYGSKYAYTIETDKIPTKYIIYKAISPSSKIYIGQTICGLTTRISQHKSEAKTTNKNRAFLSAIRKYGIENIKWEIIDYCNNEKDLDEKECHYIAKYDSYNNGYNETIGGDKGSKGFIYSLELREKMSISSGGEPFNVYSLDGQLINTYISQGICAKELNLNQKLISSCLRGKSYVHKGYIFIYCDEDLFELREIKLYKANKIKIPKHNTIFNVYDLRGNLLGNYSTTIECSNNIKVSPASISKCLCNTELQNNGYIFIYDDINTGKILDKIINKLNFSIFNVYEKKTGKYIKTFNNQKECCLELGIENNVIGSCLNKKISSHKGYYFIRANEDNKERLQELLNKKQYKNKIPKDLIKEVV